MPSCNFCRTLFPTADAVKLHVRRAQRCRPLWKKQIERLNVHLSELEGSGSEADMPDVHDSGKSMDLDDSPAEAIPSDAHMDADMPLDGIPAENSTTDAAYSRRATVEDVEDDDPDDLWRRLSKEMWTRLVKSFPAEYKAGTGLGKAPTQFEKIHAAQERVDEGPWGPFLDEDEWQLAEWLVSNVGQKQADSFLKLPIVRLSY